MMSEPGWQTVTIHTLLDKSRIKDNQTMKFGSIDTDQISLCDCLYFLKHLTISLL